MPRKLPAAVSLGRRGGNANTAAQQATRAANAHKAHEASRRYRLTAAGDVQRRDDTGRWLTLAEPYDLGARRFLRRQQG